LINEAAQRFWATICAIVELIAEKFWELEAEMVIILALDSYSRCKS